MNREIKFRGKSLDNGEWVYGDLMHNAHRNKRASILCVPRVINFPGQICNVPIVKDTICQFTGLHDSDGKDIYEGDILADNECAIGAVEITPRNGVVIKRRLGANFSVALRSFTYDSDFNIGQLSELKIIGNIHDNPELLQ